VPLSSELRAKIVQHGRALAPAAHRSFPERGRAGAGPGRGTRKRPEVPHRDSDSCTETGQLAWGCLVAKWLGLLPNAWLRGVDLNHRPLGYEWIPSTCSSLISTSPNRKHKDLALRLTDGAGPLPPQLRHTILHTTARRPCQSDGCESFGFSLEANHQNPQNLRLGRARALDRLRWYLLGAPGRG